MTKPNEKREELVHIGSVLNHILRGFHEKANGNMALVWRFWDETVGETIAQNARPVIFKGRLLYVNVTSSPWIHQLQYLKQEIIEKLNSALGQNVVDDIRFRIGS